MENKVPSFKGLHPASAIASKAKRGNKRHNTMPELLLRRELWHMGHRFRKNVDSLPGKPDIVFMREKVAVFCDGDFWHGYNWPSRRAKLKDGTNAAYWLAKIEANMERDKRHTAELEQTGWHVIRLWESDIKRNPQAAALHIQEIISACRSR